MAKCADGAGRSLIWIGSGLWPSGRPRIEDTRETLDIIARDVGFADA